MKRAAVLAVVAFLVAGCARTEEADATQVSGESPASSPSASAFGDAPVPSAAASSSTHSPEAGAAGTRLETAGTVATVVTAWGDGFAAMGDGLIWTSTDGLTWEVEETAGLDGVVVEVVERADGNLLAFGYLEVRDTDAFRTWTSLDGVTWQQDSALPGEFVFLDVARGSRGYVLAGRALLDAGGPNPEQLWFSSDARTWELVRDTRADMVLHAVGAGPEGFVAVGQQGWQSGEPYGLVVASSDGRTWVEPSADDPAVAGARGLWGVAPVGGDWVTVPYTIGDELQVLWSANGLAWEVRTSLPVEPVDVGVLGHLYSDGGRVFLGITDGGGRTVTVDGLLTSEDGVSWSSTGIPQPRMPNAYAVNGDVILFLVDGTVYSG